MDAGVYIAAMVFNAGMAFIPAAMAKKKGYSFGGYWCFGFFLSWLIALIVISVKSNKNEVQQEVLQPNTTVLPPNNQVKHCGVCGHVLGNTTKFCGNCGSEIPL